MIRVYMSFTKSSTTLIPKCSSTIVLRPILARESHPNTSECDALITNSTLLASELGPYRIDELCELLLRIFCDSHTYP